MFRVVIPARYGSSRLPGKPLLLIGGRPMLQWVYERGVDSGAETVVIATDDDRIAEAANAFGAKVQLTSLTHVSGADRIAEVAMQAGWNQDDVIVNLQGDEPMMPSSLVRQVAQLLQQQASAETRSRAVLASTHTHRTQLASRTANRRIDRRSAPWCASVAAHVPALRQVSGRLQRRGNRRRRSAARGCAQGREVGGTVLAGPIAHARSPAAPSVRRRS